MPRYNVGFCCQYTVGCTVRWSYFKC